MKNKIEKHNLIILFLFIIFIFILIIKGINIFNKFIDEENINKQREQIIVDTNNLQSIIKNKNYLKKMDTTYYLNNIFAYGVLKLIKKLEISQKDSKYNDTSCLEITFEKMEKEKLLQTIIDLSLLGFIDFAENGKIILHVYTFSIEDAKEIVNKNIISENKEKK